MEAVASRLDLREPNKEALKSIAAVVADHYEIAKSEETFEGVVDVATGVGKTYILAAALEYFAALGARNFAVTRLSFDNPVEVVQYESSQALEVGLDRLERGCHGLSVA